MDAKQLGERLVEMVNANQFLEAINELYADDIVSQEAHGDESMPARMEGIQAIKGKSEWWLENHEVHSTTAEGPFPCQDKFAVIIGLDVTPKIGPMAGQRFQMKEVAVYTARGGKVAHEEFFYDVGG